MRHQRTRDIFEYWQSLRKGRPAPRRLDIDPIEIGGHLPFVFILERRDYRRYSFRLAGTYVCDCFGRELRHCSFRELWRGPDQPAVDDVLRSVTEACCAVAIEFGSCSGRPEQRMTFETVLLPLVTGPGDCDRVLGTLTALDCAISVGHRGLEPLQLLLTKLIWAGGFGGPNVGWRAVDGRRVEISTPAGRQALRVIAGGRESSAR